MSLQQIREKLHSPMGRDVLWTFVVQILVMACGFAITKILSNRLSIDDFGLFSVIKRSTMVLSFMMLAGTGIAIPRYLTIYHNQQLPFKSIAFNQVSFILVFLTSTLLILFCLLLPHTIGSLIVGKDAFSLLVTALLYAFTFTTSSFLYAYFRGTDQFGKFNISQALVQLCCILPLLLLPVLTVYKVYIAWIMVIAGIVCVFSTIEIYKNHAVFIRRFCSHTILQQFKEVISYSSPRMIGDFFLFSINAFPLVYLSKYYHFQDVAYFSVGLTFVTLGTSFFSILGYILLPYVSGALARHEIKQAGRSINQLLFVYIATAILLTLFFLAFTPFMIRLFFAQSYLVTADLTQIMLLAILPQSIYLLYRNPIDAISKTPYNTINLGICLTIMIVAFYQLDTLESLAYAFLGVSILKGIFSIITWEVLKKKRI
ncbi:MAG: lipopolysaccharide biosynthesis protein [Prevotella sp.]|nr:lipopolysaccharide biosynthesis protein [Prevotella sp.]